jgi:hypothetical protein
MLGAESASPPVQHRFGGAVADGMNAGIANLSLNCAFHFPSSDRAEFLTYSN